MLETSDSSDRPERRRTDAHEEQQTVRAAVLLLFCWVLAWNDGLSVCVLVVLVWTLLMKAEVLDGGLEAQSRADGL